MCSSVDMTPYALQYASGAAAETNDNRDDSDDDDDDSVPNGDDEL